MLYNLSFPELVSELRRIHQENLSGTVLVKTEDGRLAQFNISNGNIIFLSMSTHRGIDALSDIKKITTCSFQFLHNVISGLKTNLPPTTEILNYLATTTGDVIAPIAPKEDKISPEVKSMLKAILAEFIGPAAFIVSDEPLRKAGSLEIALDALANEIPNTKDRASFKEKAKKKLDIHPVRVIN